MQIDPTPPTGTTPATPPAAPPAEPAAGGAAASPTPPAEGEVTTPPAEGNPPAEGAPAEPPKPIELKAPEGMEVDEALLASFAAFAGEKGLSPEVAQALVEFHAAETGKAVEAAKQGWEARKTAWAEEIKADPAIGGANLKASLEAGERALDRFGSPALRQILEDTGLSHHPDLVRLFVGIGKAIGDDSIAGTTAANPGPRSDEEKLRDLYPSMFK